jgi:dTDP-4-amino-4,6-dideoxygalactose transaminase
MSNDPIPQVDVLAGYRAYESLIQAAVGRVLESGWYVLGKEVKSLEQRFADYVGVDHGIGVASGTDAIEVALRSCGIGAGDLVFTVSHTAVATVVGIERSGAEVAFVDIDHDTFTMSPASLESTIASIQASNNRNNGGRRLAAVVPVHLYGQMADMESISQIARRNGLRVIEDCAQAHGASSSNRRAGSWGDAATFSFYPTKNLGAVGDGGMMVTSNSDLATRAGELRQYGWRERYISSSTGINSRLDELQAAILNAKLDSLDADNGKRKAIAQRYNLALAQTSIEPPHLHSSSQHVFHQYVVRSDSRDDLQRHLKQAGIATALHYPQPVHRQEAYENRCLGNDQLPVTDAIASRILSLPMYPQLTESQVMRICKSLESWSA